MIPLPLLSLGLNLLGNWQKYAALLGLGVLLLLTGYIKGCTDERVKSVAFQAKVEALGEEAKKRVKEQEAKDKLKKEQADRENQVSSKRIADLSRQLRESRSAKRYVPPAAPGSASPDRATFDRAELDGAIRRLDAGVQGLIDEGDTAVTDLNTARKWAKP
jgi:hypothetical protein